MHDVWVVIPAHRPRLDDLAGCLRTLRHDPHKTVVVWNGDQEPPELPCNVAIDSGTELNISRWWNLGLEYVSSNARPVHDVLVLNCDARVTQQGVDRLASALRQWDLAMVGPTYRGEYNGPETRINRELKPVSHWDRVAGFCFMLARELGIRADERLRWWFGDDDIEWQARRLRGTGLVPGVRVEHPPAGGTRIEGELRSIVGKDAKVFEATWHTLPTTEMVEEARRRRGISRAP
jgi:hypothetical protein